MSILTSKKTVKTKPSCLCWKKWKIGGYVYYELKEKFKPTDWKGQYTPWHNDIYKYCSVCGKKAEEI